jgi:hypothetical protein
LVEADTLDLAVAAAARLGEQADAQGSGATVRIDREPIERALAALALCALRHGALEHVGVRADGTQVLIEPVNADAAPVVLAEELKDLGAAAALRVIEASGGRVALEGETLRVHLVRRDT